MEKYWKLLDLKEHEYSAHETEEEINHIIEFKTRNMEDDRVIRRIDIKTPFPNYNFQHVVAFDSENIYYFLYFFDSIEEQCDCFEEELHEREQLISDMCEHVTHIKVHRDVDIDEKQREFEDAFEAMESQLKDEIKDLSNQLDEVTKQRDNAINLLNEKTTALFNANHTIDFLRKRIYELEVDCLKWRDYVHELKADDSERSEIDYLKEVIKSKESRIDILEAGIKESERNEEFWKSRCGNLKEILDKINDLIYPF